MKRPALLLLAGFAVLFGIATALRSCREESEEVASFPEQAERLRRFWSAYHDGASARAGGDHESAARFFREALAIDPRHEDSLFYLAISLEESGRYLEAAEVLRRLTAVNPESGRGWSQLGSLLARRVPGNAPDFEGAAAAFSKAEAINREHSGPFLSRGALALELGDLSEAGRLFGIASDMSSPEGSFLAGLVAFLEDDDRNAIRLFSRVLEASAREKAITGRGMASEGDVELSSKLTPLESAHLRALVFLHWTARRLGGYPPEVPESFRIELPERAAMGRVVERVAAPRSGCMEGQGIDFGATVVDTACADYDSDGDLDTFVLLWKKPGRLLRNDGPRRTDVTGEVGLAGVGGEGLSVLFFDYDGDSDVDLLVTAHAPLALSLRRLLAPEGRARTLTPRLFANENGERFVEVTTGVGLDRHYGVVDAEAFDFDSDGWPDLVFAMGGFEAGHLEPSVVLRNRKGEEFAEWAHVPSSDEPRNAGGVEVRGGEIETLLAPAGRAW